MLKKVIFILLFQIIVNAQEIPHRSFLFKSQKLSYDVGKNWNLISSLGTTRFKDIPENNKESYFSFKEKHRINLNNLAAINILNFSNFIYKKYFFGYIYTKIYNSIKFYNGLNGQYEGWEKLNYLKAEIQFSGFGFQNDWVTLQIAKDREDWSSGNNISLALSKYSHPYDYLLLASNYGNLRVKYIHGFLETIHPKMNRFITARGVEWTNQKYFNIGVSEVIIYQGENRSLDIGYLNPISTHLEVELNNRLNIPGGNSANAVWQIALDYYLKKYQIRLSGNFLYDEFVIDKQQLIEGKEHGKAYSWRIAYSPFNLKQYFFTLYLSKIHVGSHTFRHVDGLNNFSHRGSPLGWNEGSDGEQISIGVNIFNLKNLIFGMEYKFLQLGEETIKTRPYEQYKTYLKSSFPSGKVYNINSIDINIEYLFNQNTSISIKYIIDKNFIKNSEFNLSLATSHSPLKFFQKKLFLK